MKILENCFCNWLRLNQLYSVRDGEESGEKGSHPLTGDSVDSSELKIFDQLENLIAIWDQIDWTLELKNRDMSEKFFIFKVATTSPYLLCCYVVMQTIYYLQYWSSQLTSSWSTWHCLLSALSIFGMLPLLWFLFIVRAFYPGRQQVKSFRMMITMIESVITLGAVLINGITLGLHCHGFLVSSKACPNEHIPSYMSGSTLTLLTALCISPLIHLTIFSFVSYRMILFTQFVKLSILGSLMLRLPHLVPISWLIPVVIVIMACLVMYRLQQLSFFIAFRKIDEDKRTSEIQKAANGVCSMISHDYKTPMCAFLAGFEDLFNTLNDALQTIESNSLSPQRNLFPEKSSILRDQLNHCKSTVDLLMATYQFLLMTINRATDYTRCFHKLSLIPNIAPINLFETVVSTIATMKQIQGKVCVELEIVHRENLSEYILTDKDWLMDNLLCLLVNAMNLSADERCLVRLKQIDRHGQLFLRFEVEDCGPGFKIDGHTTNDIAAIDKTVLNTLKRKIEEPTYNHRDELGGMGLGLFCLSQRVYALSGDYGIKKRKKGKGTVVWFTIPYKDYKAVKSSSNASRAIQIATEFKIESKASPLQLNTQSIEQEEQEGKYVELNSDLQTEVNGEGKDRADNREKGNLNLSNMSLSPNPVPSVSPRRTVLVVDDSLPVAKMISLSLKRHGFIPIVVNNGLEAVRAVMGNDPQSHEIISEGNDRTFITEQSHILQRFDAIIMDLQMPVMTGFEAIRHIRALEKTASFTKKPFFIVAISAGTNPEEVERAYQAGANHFLPKPFEMKTFLKLYQDNNGE